MTALTHKATIYVPSTLDCSKPAPAELVKKAIADTARTLSRMFGGATATAAHGYYEASSGELVEEEITQVYAYAAEITAADMTALQAICEELKKDFTQECISLEIDSALYFV